VEERKLLERQLAEAKKQIAMGGSGKDAGPAIVEVGGRKFLKLSVTGVEMKDLKAMADDGRAKIGSGIVAIANNSVDGKLGIVVAVTTDLAGEVSAVDLVRAGSEAVGGKGGGGRPDMAQAGGPDGSRADAALQAIEDRLNAA
jgi:alanyl-tRNA synthetase